MIIRTKNRIINFENVCDLVYELGAYREDDHMLTFYYVDGRSYSKEYPDKESAIEALNMIIDYLEEFQDNGDYILKI